MARETDLSYAATVLPGQGYITAEPTYNSQITALLKHHLRQNRSQATNGLDPASGKLAVLPWSWPKWIMAAPLLLASRG